jgi:hypothetical protein
LECCDGCDNCSGKHCAAVRDCCDCGEFDCPYFINQNWFLRTNNLALWEDKSRAVYGYNIPVGDQLSAKKDLDESMRYYIFLEKHRAYPNRGSMDIFTGIDKQYRSTQILYANFTGDRLNSFREFVTGNANDLPQIQEKYRNYFNERVQGVRTRINEFNGEVPEYQRKE